MSVIKAASAPVRPAKRRIRDWVSDSARWDHYRPRAGDVIIATAPKVGTTWTQQIVRLLIFQDPAPTPIRQLSPWLDARFQIPIDVAIPLLESQTHTRFLKSHLPFDALPLYEEVRYIHVARDPRDAAMSYSNHYNSLTQEALEKFDEIGVSDDTIGRPFPRAPRDARGFFLEWMGREGDDGATASAARFFDTERTYWSERKRPNLLLVHYNDLKADLEGEMRRIAEYLDIVVPEALWPALVKAATFDQMKADGGALLSGAERTFKGGHESFLHKGTNGRWRGVLTDADLALYENRAAAALSPGLRAWLEGGRAFGDPRALLD